GAAEKLVDRLFEQLALEVPQRDVECGKGAGQRTLRPELGKSMEKSIEQHRVIERVLADQHGCEIALNDPERGEATLHRRRLADPGGAVIAMNPDPGAALLRL